jgi:acylglycerol lipase
VYGVDYEGHGKSAGLKGYVENMDHVINDCSSHFTSICGQILFYFSL